MIKVKGNERQPDESYEDYRVRLDTEQEYIKYKKRGVNVWAVRKLGPYINPARQLKKKLKKAEEKAND